MKGLLILLLSVFVVSCAQYSESDYVAAGVKRSPTLSKQLSRKLLTPTTYSISVYDLTEMKCAVKKKLKDIKDNVLFSVCKEVYMGCQMEGTCLVKQGSKKLLLNVDDVRRGERRFIVVQDPDCVFGNGARRDKVKGYSKMCLDPYYSVAADLNIYKLGDVIYVPSAVGVVLPNGSVHDGHFIVRDAGGAIKGPGRFDFFSGFKSANNPLKRAGFSDKTNNVPYYVVNGVEADQILKTRNFPSVPVGK